MTINNNVRTSNPTERRVVDRLSAEGWEVLKRGWPDFIAVKDGEVRFIEVKPQRSRKRHWTDLVTTQLRVAELLHEAFGVEVEVLRD